MNIRRKLSLAVVTIGITVAAVGCSAVPASAPEVVNFDPVTVAQPQILAPDVHLEFSRSEVTTSPAPPKLAPIRKESAVKPVTITPADPSETATFKTSAPGVATPNTANAAPVTVAAPAVDREVYVGLAGGQNIVDLGRGPVLFPLPAGFPPYVAEHDSMGGWARFGTLRAGNTVRLSGLVTGTYTVGQIINVPKGGSTAEFGQFATMPKVLLQTCVPGTNRMIVVGLY